MQRVPVISVTGNPLMPAIASRVRRWLKEGKATERQVSVSDANWKRLGQFSAKKVQLLQRSTGLIVTSTRLTDLVPSVGLSNLTPLRGQI